MDEGEFEKMGCLAANAKPFGARISSTLERERARVCSGTFTITQATPLQLYHHSLSLYHILFLFDLNGCCGSIPTIITPFQSHRQSTSSLKLRPSSHHAIPPHPPRLPEPHRQQAIAQSRMSSPDYSPEDRLPEWLSSRLRVPTPDLSQFSQVATGG